MKSISTPISDAIKKVRLFSIFSRTGISKRIGDSIPQIVFAVLVWPLLPVKSIAAFCGRFVAADLNGGMNVIYDFLKREDINWRRISTSTSKAVYDNHRLGNESESAFCVDDSTKHRRGRKVEGVSSHFDHTQVRHVMGQQILQLGLVCGLLKKCFNASCFLAIIVPTCAASYVTYYYNYRYIEYLQKRSEVFE